MVRLMHELSSLRGWMCRSALRRAFGPSLRFLPLLLLALTPLLAAGAPMPTARLVKVLPHFVDKQSRIALSPSLYERDAYQAHLRKNPSEQGGMRFDVQWKSGATNRFLLRLELRGNKVNVGTTLV